MSNGSLPAILEALEALREPAVLATLVRTRGSSYRLPGARMIIHPDGGQTGVVSAGCMEADLHARAGAVLATGAPALAHFDLGSDLDLIWGTGMGCQGVADVLLEAIRPEAPPAWVGHARDLLARRAPGAMATVLATGARHLAGPGLPESLAGPHGPLLAGVLAGGSASAHQADGVDLLVEPILPPFALWVVGAGENARPLVHLAKTLGWRTGVVDHRPALVTPERFPDADRRVLGRPPEVFQDLPLDGRTAVVILSHVYEQDKAALAALLDAPVGYLGLQGNRRRSARILAELGRPAPALAAPAGLDLGAETPEAIALAMLAEAHAVLAGRTGAPLRLGAGPIHGR